MYPNFQEIAKIENQLLRIALYTSKGDERTALEKAFPQCYMDHQTTLRVQASLLRQRAGEYSVNTFGSDSHPSDRELCWRDVLEELGVPIAFDFSTDSEASVPPEVRDQLIGQTLKGGMTVSYSGETFVVATFIDTRNELELGSVIKEITDDYGIVLVHSSFVDLNS